ncbi:MAG: YlbF family regulator [Clostridia bacterium]|nr:YlbF family regulator [Clostridia bacterium]
MTVNEIAKMLGEAVKEHPDVREYAAAKAAYDADEDLQSAVREYTTQRMALGQEFAKDREMQDGELIKALQERIDFLYEKVMTSPCYKAVEAAQNKVNALMQSVNSDIQFYAFGERPCTHDCSSCGADCGSRQK